MRYFLILLFMLALPFVASAQVYEGFDLNISGGVSVAGQAGATSTGWKSGSTWAAPVGSSIYRTDGLTLGSLEVAGGRVENVTTVNFGGQVQTQRAIAGGMSGTFYSSNLFRIEGSLPINDNQAVGSLILGGFNDAGGKLVLSSREYQANGQGGIRIGQPTQNQSTAVVLTGTPLSANVTYMFLARFVTGPSTTVDGFLLDAAQFDAFVAGGRDINSLNGTNTTQHGTAFNAASVSLAADDLISMFSAANQAGSLVFSMDEIRLGTAILDVTPTPVPEPASLLALAGMGLLAWRRLGKKPLSEPATTKGQI